MNDIFRSSNKELYGKKNFSIMKTSFCQKHLPVGNSLSVCLDICVAFANSLQQSVGRRHFVDLMSPVQGHVACRNLPLTGPHERETKTRSGNDPRNVRAIAPKMFAI